MDLVRQRRVILRRIEVSWWLAEEVPSLPGCLSQGEMKEETLENVKGASQGYTAVLEEGGLPVPPDDYKQAGLTLQ